MLARADVLAMEMMETAPNSNYAHCRHIISGDAGGRCQQAKIRTLTVDNPRAYFGG